MGILKKLVENWTGGGTATKANTHGSKPKAAKKKKNGSKPPPPFRGGKSY